MKRAGEAQLLRGGEGVDVALEPFAPHGACVRGVPAVPLSQAGAACSELDRQLVEEPAELGGEASDVSQGDRLRERARAARRSAVPSACARLGDGRPRAAPRRSRARWR